MSPDVPPPPHPPVVTPPWAVGADRVRLDRFILGDEIGRGGMGKVHRAWDPMLRRVVALKILLRDDPIQMMHFLREAQIQARVDHPNVCKVFEVGTYGDQPYIAMQYIEGQTLSALRADLSVRDITRILADIAGAVHAAHRQGLIHRDIKPGNLLLETHDEGGYKPYILDFGLARDLSNQDMNMSWGLVGTPAYMAPEQARGEAIGPTADVYGLGATLYASLAGMPPHEANSIQDLVKAHQDDVTTLRRSNTQVPRDLEAVILKCLEYEPSRRYPSALALEEDLRRWLSGEPVQARVVGPVGRWYARLMRNKTLVGTVVGSAVVLVGALAWNAVATKRDRSIRQLAITFAMDVSRQESLLRLERILPMHSIRPALERFREQGRVIEQRMREVGDLAVGPGHYALGRISLELNDLARAQSQLETAWKNQFQTPEVASAIGTVLARRYLEEVNQAMTLEPMSRSLRLQELKTTRAPIIEGYFKKVNRTSQRIEHYAMGEAYLAIAKGDYPQAIQKCQEAYNNAVWLYEAKLLQAQAIELLTESSQAPLEESSHFQAWVGCLDIAYDSAKSDERTYAGQIRKHGRLALQLLRRGKGAEEHFRTALDLFETSLRVRSDSLETTTAFMQMLNGTAKIRMSQGIDFRKEILPILQRFQSVLAGGVAEARPAQADLQKLVNAFATMQYLRGEDPRTWLDWNARQDEGGDSLETLESRLIQVRFLVARGLDPTDVFTTLFRRLAEQQSLRAKDAAFWDFQGQVWWEFSRWQLLIGSDPREAMAKAADAYERAQAIQPSLGMGLALATVSNAQAYYASLFGDNVEAQLKKARAFGDQLASLTTDPAILKPYQALLRVTEVMIQLDRSGGGPASVADVAKEMDAAVSHAPADFRVRFRAARAHLLEAVLRMRADADPGRNFVLAEEHARRGLEVKRDSLELQQVMLHVQVLQAIQARRRHQDASVVIKAGLLTADSMLRTLPSHLGARWMKGLLLELQHESSGLKEIRAAEKGSPALVRGLRAMAPGADLLLKGKT